MRKHQFYLSLNDREAVVRQSRNQNAQGLRPRFTVHL